MESDRVRVRIRHVGRDDDWDDDTLGGTHDFDVRPGRPQGSADGKPFAPTGWFATGYFLAWIGFSLGANLLSSG